MGYVFSRCKLFGCSCLAIAAMFIGAMWYGPIFGKMWIGYMGKTEEQLKEDFNPGKTYTLAFIGHFIALGILANLFFYINVSTIGAALHTAFWTWLGFTLATNFITGLFENKKFGLLIIDEVYHLVVFFVGAVIIYVW
jgi:hypothetical protein